MNQPQTHRGQVFTGLHSIPTKNPKPCPWAKQMNAVAVMQVTVNGHYEQAMWTDPQAA